MSGTFAARGGTEPGAMVGGPGDVAGEGSAAPGQQRKARVSYYYHGAGFSFAYMS